MSEFFEPPPRVEEEPEPSREWDGPPAAAVPVTIPDMLAQRTGEIPAGKLRLGFLFADGSKAANTGAHFDWHDEPGKPPDAPVMRSRGERGDDRLWHSSFWVWPLPPPGKLEFLCEWPAAGIPLTRVKLDAGAMAEAPTRALRLFSDN